MMLCWITVKYLRDLYNFLTINDRNTYIKAFMPRVEPTATSVIKPMNQITNKLYILGIAIIQYIITKKIQSGEK
tara:strand:+ start:213 stop:434 length:222 start_codon:yes stop_codon:yes gene_type:complete